MLSSFARSSKRFQAFARLMLSFILLQPGLALASVTKPDLSHKASSREPDEAAQAEIRQAFLNLPLAFEKNEGQFDPQVRFVARGKGYTLFITPAEMVLVFRKEARSEKLGVRSSKEFLPANSSLLTGGAEVIRMRLVNGNRLCRVTGVEKLPGKSNYFIGNDPDKWRTDVPHYSKVELEGVYPGIDLVYYGNAEGKLEYDFVVEPGADPKGICLKFDGAEKLTVGQEGELRLGTKAGEIAFQVPEIYQKSSGSRSSIEGGFLEIDRRVVGFEVARYDTSRTLVIDPVLDYSTLLGGSSTDWVTDIKLDAANNIVFRGYADGNMPSTAGVFQPTYGGGSADLFVGKLNPTGTALIFLTYLGGAGGEGGGEGGGMALDAAENIYVTGITEGGFPITAGTYQAVFGGGTSDAFLAALNPAGNALIFSTYFGGNGDEGESYLALDGTGDPYIAGSTTGGIPTTAGAYQAVAGSAQNSFAAKFNNSGTVLIYSTYLGGASISWGKGVAVDGAGRAYVIGEAGGTGFPTTPGAFQPILGGARDVYLSVLDPAGTNLAYSTLIGGSDDDWWPSITVDAGGVAYVTGWAHSTDFPTTPGALQVASAGPMDAFISKIDPSGNGVSDMIFSTYLGGIGPDFGRGIAVDAIGNVYVTGVAYSGFPTTSDAFQSATASTTNSDAFVAVINPAGNTLVYSTYITGTGGSSGLAIEVDSAGAFYVAGGAIAPFSTTAGAFQMVGSGMEDGFIARFSSVLPTPTPTITGTPTPACHNTLAVPVNLYSPRTGALSLAVNLCQDGRYTVKIYNTAGEHIRTLRDIPNQPALIDQVDWDGKNEEGEEVASGVYLIQLVHEFGAQLAKVVVIR